MSRPLPRAIYWRRPLLLVALAILIAWAAVQFWPRGGSDDPVGTSPTVTTPTATVAPPTPAPIPSPSPTPAPTRPADETTTQVALSGGGTKCDTHKIRMTVDVAAGQQAQQPVQIDLSISTTAREPCLFKPKTFDPLAVVNAGDKRVWDSSVCNRPVAEGTVQIVPGWATVARVPWVPRKSGKHCSPTAAWLPEGTYTLQVGTLGGEPGKVTFHLAEPPPPAPTPSTTPAPVPNPQPTAPVATIAAPAT